MRRYLYLLRYITRHWKGRLLIFVVTLLSGSLGLLQPWPMKILVDNVLGSRSLPPPLAHVAHILPGALTPQGLLVWVVLASMAVFAINSTVDVILTRAWIMVGQGMVYDLGADIFSHVQRQSLLFHSRNSLGDSLSRITGDSWCVFTVVERLLFGPMFASVTTVGVLAVMVRMDPGLTVTALAVVPFAGLSSFFVGRMVRRVTRRQRDVQGRIQSHVHRAMAGISIVQAFGQEDREVRRLQDLTASAIAVQRRQTLIGSLNGLTSGLAAKIGTGIVLWIGAEQVLAGQLTLGSLLVFLAYLGTLRSQVNTFTGMYGGLQGVGASVDRVMEVMEVDSEVPEVPGAREMGVTQGAVALEGVTFGYEAERPVLRQVWLEAEPGETVAIVGPTGVGKSTLMSLIPRFYDPWDGRVLLDGQDVRELQLRSLRAQIALVLQEPFLFPVSLAENIAYGRPDASRAEIEAAATAANAHAFIERLPQGYNTVLGERGATLSGGERQRISIARALLKDAPILILDEPTSALDAETEALLLEALERLMAGRTTFIIAHRLSTIRGADRIAVLQEGRIAEMAPHDALLAQNGIYARLYRRQMGQTTPAQVAG